MIPEIRKQSYWERLVDLDLIILVQGRLRGQLIEVVIYISIDTPLIVREGFSIEL